MIIDEGSFNCPLIDFCKRKVGDISVVGRNVGKIRVMENPSRGDGVLHPTYSAEVAEQPRWAQ